MAVATQAGIMKDNKLPRAGRALFVDSLATIVGAIFGTTTTTSYIESTSGVAVGARTGFASIVTGICFLLALFFSPLIEIVTSAVTTPALVVVGILMATNFAEINWKKFEVAVPKIYNNYYDATIIFNCDWYRLRIYILSNNYAYHKNTKKYIQLCIS